MYTYMQVQSVLYVCVFVCVCKGIDEYYYRWRGRESERIHHDSCTDKV